MAVKLVKDELTKKSKGYAFIQYTSQDDALIALENMDRQVHLSQLAFAFQAIFSRVMLCECIMSTNLKTNDDLLLNSKSSNYIVTHN